MRKAYPNNTKPIPTGVKNLKGKIVTNPEERKQVTLDNFDQRIRKRPVNIKVKKIVDLKKDLFKEILDKAKENKRPPLSMKVL